MLAVQSLALSIAGRAILKELEFTLAAGNCLWLHGINGSGKSTLLRCLAGLITPYAGKILFAGNQLDEFALRKNCNWLGHSNGLNDALTVAQQIKIFLALRNLTTDLASKLADFNLQPLLQTRISSLSAGKRRQLAIMLNCIRPARVWLLDEPNTCLDQAAEHQLAASCNQFMAAGGSIVFASHSLPDGILSERLCTLDLDSRKFTQAPPA